MRWLIPVLTGAWGILKWSQEREQVHKRDREIQAALYFNPFLSACEDLQSRIYSVLELDGIRSLRKRYPDERYAEETVYLIVRFFGWLATVMRSGPYSQDPEMIRLTEAVRSAFSSSKFPIGPFNFLRPEQKALGKLVMTRFKGQYGIELDTISVYRFERRLKSPPLAESQSIQQSIDALKRAKSSRSLQGRLRLAEVQNRLVDLLTSEEARAGIRFFPGKRLKCTLEKALPEKAEVLGIPAPVPQS